MAHTAETPGLSFPHHARRRAIIGGAATVGVVTAVLVGNQLTSDNDTQDTKDPNRQVGVPPVAQASQTAAPEVTLTPTPTVEATPTPTPTPEKVIHFAGQCGILSAELVPGAVITDGTGVERGVVHLVMEGLPADGHIDPSDPGKLTRTANTVAKISYYSPLYDYNGKGVAARTAPEEITVYPATTAGSTQDGMLYELVGAVNYGQTDCGAGGELSVRYGVEGNLAAAIVIPPNSHQ